MADDRTRLRLSQFKESVERLGEALAQNETEFIRDSIIKRFEICFELAWHALQERLREEGIAANSPTRALQGAHQLGWITDEEAWTKVLENRNLTVHTYDKKIAMQVSAFVRASGDSLMRELAQKIAVK